MQQSAPKKQSKVLTSAEGNKRVSLEDRFEKQKNILAPALQVENPDQAFRYEALDKYIKKQQGYEKRQKQEDVNTQWTKQQAKKKQVRDQRMRSLRLKQLEDCRKSQFELSIRSKEMKVQRF